MAIIAGTISFCILDLLLFAVSGSCCELQDFRDGKRLLGAFQKGYVSHVTNHEPGVECLVLVRESISDDNGTATFITSYTEEGSTTMGNQKTTWRISVDCGATIEVIESNDTGASRLSQLLYSDYKTCKINTDPYNCPGCHMFVMNDATDEDIAACLEQLKHFCGTDIYDAYNEASCDTSRLN